jgi:hypothetical protein
LLLFVIISVIIMKCKSDYIGETHSQKGWLMILISYCINADCVRRDIQPDKCVVVYLFNHIVLAQTVLYSVKW